MRIVLLVIYNWGEECIVPFNLPPGGEVGICIDSKETYGRIHSFEFPSGTSKEKVNNNNIEEKTLFIPLTVDA